MEVADPISAILSQKGSDLWQVAPDATVFDAIRLMSDRNVGALLVMRGAALAGVVSERDYTRKVILRGKSSKDIPVSDIMTSDVLCVSPDDSVEKCMEIMTDRKIRHLPVVRDGTVTGIVSIGDLVRWIISAQRALIAHLDNYITGKYPG